MPRGNRLVVNGLLLEHRRRLVLRVDGGGQWRLDPSRQAKALLGRRVTVVGVRDGFDLLHATRIVALNTRRANAPTSDPRGGPALTNLAEWVTGWTTRATLSLVAGKTGRAGVWLMGVTMIGVLLLKSSH